MRQHPLLRWIEQAEARKATDAAFFERAAAISTKREPRRGRTGGRDTPGVLRPLLRRLRPFRSVNDLC